MDIPRPTLGQVAHTAGYLLLGVVGTAAVTLVALLAGGSIQPIIYDLFYLQVGPSEATETAILTHFLLAEFVAVSLVLVAGDYLSDRLTHRSAVRNVIATLLGLLVVFLLLSVLGLAAFLTAILVLAAAVIAVPLLLWVRYDVRSGALPAFVGAVPVLVLVLLIAGFGVGWGWGYLMTAERVPASTVNSAAADFDDVPQLRDDLFTGDCAGGPDGRDICRLYLRGYAHEAQAVRFMARHGVRCAYQNDPGWESDSFIATYNESYYRVTCSPHGD